MKKGLIFLFAIVLLSSLVLAQDYKLEISTAQETFEADKNISIKVTLYEDGKLLNDNVQVIVEDAEKRIKVEQTIPSNDFVDINVDGASYGQGKITAIYKDVEATGNFVIEIQELAKFEISGDKLTITNIGNTRYTKTVQIIIGETVGIKQPKLNPGKSVSYRLIAPDGVYNIRVTDGNQRSNLEVGGVSLTGRAIGILDESISGRSGLTGGIRPQENGEVLDYLKRSKFTYIFVLAVFGAMILLAIERRYRKRVSK